MARLFSTYFPLNPYAGLEDAINQVGNWISTSRYNPFNESDLAQREGDLDLNKNGYYLGIITREFEEGGFFGVSYIQPETGRHGEGDWTTQIVGFNHKDNGFEISVCVDYDSENHIYLRNKKAKPPVINRFLIDNIGGDYDGLLQVKAEPHKMEDDEHHASFVKWLMSENSEEVSLPVVYVSRDSSGRTAFDPEEMAKKLAGTAHVVLEPSRDFSFKLKEQWSKRPRNAYGGNVGVYWPCGYIENFQPTDDSGNSVAQYVIDNIVETTKLAEPPSHLDLNNVRMMEREERLKNLRGVGHKKLTF